VVCARVCVCVRACVYVYLCACVCVAKGIVCLVVDSMTKGCMEMLMPCMYACTCTQSHPYTPHADVLNKRDRFLPIKQHACMKDRGRGLQQKLCLALIQA